MSEPKPVYYDGIYTDGTCYISSDIPTTTDQPDPTYITALNLRIDALCGEVGRLRTLIRDVYKAIEYRDNVVEAVNMLEEEILN